MNPIPRECEDAMWLVAHMNKCPNEPAANERPMEVSKAI